MRFQAAFAVLLVVLLAAACSSPGAEQATPTPSAEQATPTPVAEQPTPTPSAEQATPTPSVEQATPTPSAEQATPTPVAEQATPTPGAEQATPTPGAEQATPTPSAADCSPGRPHEAGRLDATLMSGGLEREYILYVPASYDGSEAVPLVLNLHGLGSDARSQAAYSGMPAKAEEEGFIAVMPQGTGDEAHWNITAVKPRGEPDDVAFIGDLLDALESQLCIDTARVFATGISNGAAMSVRLACSLSDRVVAIAPVAGVYFPLSCSATRPVPVIAFHGTEDEVLPFEGGAVATSGLPTASVEESVADWAAHNGCDSSPEEQQVTEHVQRQRYSGCEEEATVELYIVEGGGHTWPGSEVDVPPLGATTHEISATDLMWDFFEVHPLR